MQSGVEGGGGCGVGDPPSRGRGDGAPRGGADETGAASGPGSVPSDAFPPPVSPPPSPQEELKQLYAQLEMLRTRRMATRNPHLPAPPPTRSSGSRRSSSKRPHDGTGGGGREGGGPFRSRSSEHPAQDAPAGGCSEPSDSESLCGAPLLPRSASAQQLGGHGQPPRLRAVLLQKSLSAGAGEVTPSWGPPEQGEVSRGTAATAAAATPPRCRTGVPRGMRPPRLTAKGRSASLTPPLKASARTAPTPRGGCVWW